MTVLHNQRLAFTSKSLSRSASAFVILVGCLVLVGWALDIAALKSVFPDLATMKPNTALAFVLAGVALWILHDEQVDQRKQHVAQICALLVALVGLLTLSEYLFGWDLHIDQLLFKDTAQTVGISTLGRMAPATAFSFLMVGLALWFLDIPQRHMIPQIVTLIVFAVALLALVGYAYGVDSLYAVVAFSSMALHTALTFFVLSLGILWARPHRGLMAVITSDGPGGLIARRLLPAAFLIPFVIGWLRLAGLRAGLYTIEFGVALFALTNMLVFAILIVWNAGLVQRTDIERQQVEEARRESEGRYQRTLDNMMEGYQIIGFDWRYLYVNDSAARYGRQAKEELLGHTVMERYPGIEDTEMFAVLKHCMEHRTTQRAEFGFTYPDNSRAWFTFSIQPVPEGLFILTLDITEHKQAESALRQREQHLSSIYDTGGVVIFYLAVEEDGHYRFISVNKAFLSTTGLEHDQVVGKRIDEVMSPPSLTMALERYSEAIREKRTVRWEETSDYPGGRLSGAVAVVPVFDEEGKCTHLVGSVHDITERIQAEKALLESRARLSGIIESAMDAIITVDDEQRIVLFNQAAEVMFRCSAGEVTGELLERFIPPRFHQAHREHIKTFGLTGITSRRMGALGGISGVRADGDEFPIEASISQVEAGGRQYFTVILRDITERQRAEEQRAQLLAREQAARAEAEAARSRFAFLAEASILLASSLDYEATLNRLASLAVRHVADWCTVDVVMGDEAVHQLVVAHVDPEKVALARELRRRYPPDPNAPTGVYNVIRTGQPEIYPEIPLAMLEAAARDDEQRRLARELNLRSAMVVPLTARAQTLGAITFVSTQEDRRYGLADLEFAQELAQRAALAIDNARLYRESQKLNVELEQRVVERTDQLWQSEEKFSKAFQASPVAMSIATLPDGRWIEVNDALVRMTGYRREEVIGRTSIELELVDDAARANILEAVRTHGAVRNVEIQIHVKSKEILDVLVSVEQIELNGQTCALTIQYDITEIKRAEREIRRLHQDLEQRQITLEAANKELEAFSYSVSHDLRAPLRSIDGFSNILLEDHADQLDDEAQHYLQRVRAASQRMGHLIDDMLELSRLSRSELRMEQVNLTAIAHEIAADLRARQPDRQVEFVITDGLIANGDPRLLRVALANLLDNAWKFTGKQSHARIEFGLAEHNGERAYFVRDNGAGFDMAYAGKLFGAFQRLHGMADFEGTGIGLATVQRILHRHGGKVWAESAVNQGATFYFSL